jgi:putative nucleotidyltransferase with HDIG domain
MKILFVDDEPRILEGIERMLFHLADEWDITCVENGVAALDELATAPYNVVVTDMRMPGMDGAALLHEVQARFPNVVRIVLSGHAELEATLRTVSVAHQFLSKPCQADILEAVVTRAYNLQTLLHDDAVQRIVGQIHTLPSVPRIYAALTTALNDPDTDADAIADIIQQDPAMCAKVLQLVNSAFFSRAVVVADVRQAVLRLGFQMVKNLALAIEVFRAPEGGKPIAGFSIDALQHHALQAATLASKLLSDKKQAEDAFLAALLHDIGQLILAVALPDQLEAALARAQLETQPLCAAEKDLMGISHAEIGAYLLGLWGLPYPIVEAVANHHEPMRVSHPTGFGVLEAVYVANHLASGTEMDTDYLRELGVQDRLETWQDMAAELVQY